MNELDTLIAEHFPDEGNSEASAETAGKPIIDVIPEAKALEGEAPESGDPEPSKETSSEYIARLKSEKGSKKDNNLQNRLDNLAPLEKALAMKDSDPLGAAKLLGINLEKLTDAQIDAEPTEEPSLQDKFNALEKREQERDNQVLYNDMLGELKTEIKDNPDFELINIYGNESAVLELIYAAHEHGQRVTYAQAAGMVEHEMEQTYFGGYDKLHSTNKFKSKYQVNADPSKRVPSEIKNITNGDAAKVGTGKEQLSFKDEDEELRYLMKQHGI